MPLTVIPTPIGNLEDITLRALRYLREADLIACEDTRHTGRLLAHYEIKGDLISYHEHNEKRLTPELAERAKTERVALITNAGTPLEAGVEIEAIPGPSALTTALVVSGLPADTVVFAGFPPRKGRDRKDLLERVATEPSTFVLFESPHRLGKTLGDLPSETPVAVCRELTKLYEEVFRGTAEQAARRFSGNVKGEIVLVIRGGTARTEESIDDVVRRARDYVAGGESPSRAAARAARESGRRRGEVYERLVKDRVSLRSRPPE
jgi:16S rRNA (cytidine1402-2'-O)-methyltransferase